MVSLVLLLLPLPYLAQLTDHRGIINTAPIKTNAATRSVLPRRRPVVSSVQPDITLHSKLTTPQSKEDLEEFSTKDELEETTTTWIQPTPIYSNTLEDGGERLAVT